MELINKEYVPNPFAKPSRLPKMAFQPARNRVMREELPRTQWDAPAFEPATAPQPIIDPLEEAIRRDRDLARDRDMQEFLDRERDAPLRRGLN